jgi:dUTP pyrophosphatase
MAAKFEKVKRFADMDLPIPVRSTPGSAGYDFIVAEDIVVPSYTRLVKDYFCSPDIFITYTLDKAAEATKSLSFRPTLVSTGMKCKLDPGTYLELSVRSSTPFKHWLILANGVGIIDADYYGNESNDGEIFLQLINLSPWDILLKKGDKVGQGIIKNYLTTEEDVIAETTRKGGFGSTSGKEASALIRGGC